MDAFLAPGVRKQGWVRKCWKPHRQHLCWGWCQHTASPWGWSRVREKPVWLAAFVSLQPNCTEMFWEHTAAVTHGAGPYLKADRNACLTNPRITAWLQEDVLFLTQADKPLAVYQSTAAICFNKDHLHPRTGGTLNLHGKDNISSLSPKTKSCQVTLLLSAAF